MRERERKGETHTHVNTETHREGDKEKRKRKVAGLDQRSVREGGGGGGGVLVGVRSLNYLQKFAIKKERKVKLDEYNKKERIDRRRIVIGMELISAQMFNAALKVRKGKN